MFSLRIKLFLAILLASLLLIAALLGFMQWSFKTGFGNFLRQQQQHRLEAAVEDLAEHYAETGSLDNIDLRQLRRRPPVAAVGAGQPPGHGHPPPPPRFSLFVLDEQRRPQAGHYDPDQDNVLLPIRVADRVVGYVGERVRKGPQDFMERKFAEHQSRHVLLIAALATLVSLLVAYPLARVMVGRIQALLNHIRQLSEGNFATTTPVRGNDELSQLAVHLNSLGQTLHQNAQSHRTLVADISHELRTPLAVLKAQLEAVEDGVQPLTTDTVQRLQLQVNRLAGLVDDLYQLSLADLGALSYHKQMLDLRKLVTDLACSFEPQIARASLSLAVEDQCLEALTVLGDQKRLQQLFSNLLQNSVQYTNAPGQIRVTLSADNRQAIIRIADSAPGVPAELQHRLFERLFRADSSRNRNSGGAGLGLSLCQIITQAHGGQIDISDSPLGGITVSVEIPLAPA